MAAVATSIVAFVAGLGIPELSLSNNRFSRAAENFFESGSGESCGAEVSANGKQQGVGLANSQVQQDCFQGEPCQNPLQKARYSLGLPILIKATTQNLDRKKGGRLAAGTREDVGVDTGDVSSRSKAQAPPPRRRAHFDLSANTEHDVTPYSEVYGIHPRDFHFGQNGEHIPLTRKRADDSDEEDDDFESLSDRLRHRVLRCHVPWPAWGVLFSLCFMLSLLGPEALPELFMSTAAGIKWPPPVGTTSRWHVAAAGAW